MAPLSLREFIESITRFSANGIAAANITKLLTEGRLSDAELAPFLHFDAARYTRTLIHRNDDFEILALCWSAGQATPIHDHDGQNCWMVAHTGAFVVEDYRQISGKRAPGRAAFECIGTTPNVTLGMPDLRSGNERDIHKVAIAPEHDRAVSIHVYAKPVSSCFIFDESSQHIKEMPLRYDFAP